eukprot:Gb_16771 [translate_table: standard]
MEDIPLDLFDQLPEDVIQLIFGAICDCKSLVRCMAVSQAFYRHAVCISSLSIVCPDNYSTYEEKLKKIYSMVKEFRQLQTLIVRVGRPKDEPASWARCMRYAEIGASVEKFMFMAAKSGDFSELDYALSCSEWTSEIEDDISQGNTVQHGIENEGRVQLSENQRDREAYRSGQGSCSETDREIQNAAENPGLMWSLLLQRRLTSQGFPRIGRLSDFSLRQVIAPSNDVMKRMLPVIHFAILQGLNEFRDVVPSFAVNFPKLNRFLLVDLLESVTIHLRQHHLEEIRSLHLQDVPNWESDRCESGNSVSENSVNQKSLIQCSCKNLNLDAQKSPETLGHRKPPGKNHKNAEVQYLYSNSLANDFVSYGDTCERSDIDQTNGISNCEVSCTAGRKLDCEVDPSNGSLNWEISGITDNKLDCEVNPSNVHAMARGIVSEELDLANKIASDSNVQKKLRKGKGLLEDIPEITEQGTENVGFIRVKPESGVCNESFQLRAENNVSFCFQSSRSDSRYGHDDSQSSFCLHPDRAFERVEEKSYPKTEFPARQSNALSPHTEGLCSKTESFNASTCDMSHVNDPSNNRFVSFHKLSNDGECSHRLRAFEKLMEKRCHENGIENDEGGWEDISRQAKEDARTTETSGHLLDLRCTRGWDDHRESMQGENTGNCCMESLQGENLGDRQEPYRRRISRFQDIDRDGKLDIASRYPFKRGFKYDSLRLRDSARNLKIGSSRVFDNSGSSSESSRRREEGLGQGSEACRRRREQYQSEDELHYSLQMSTPTKTKSSEESPLTFYPTHELHKAIYSDCSSGQSPMESSLQRSSPAKDSFMFADKYSFAKHNFHDSDLGAMQHDNVSRSRQACEVDHVDCSLQERAGHKGSRKEESSNPHLAVAGNLQANKDNSADNRLIEREAWKETWRERVRRCRDARRDAQIEEDERRDWESQRMARNAFQRRKNDLEKEALSFDYSFWRAEQVVALNYRLSDVSMCIATYSAKPLGEADIEILSYAALAGPLLAATVSHVNKQHSSHNL